MCRCRGHLQGDSKRYIVLFAGHPQNIVSVSRKGFRLSSIDRQSFAFQHNGFGNRSILFQKFFLHYGAKYKPPAMRVRDVSYTKNHLSVIIEVFRPLLKKGKVILMAKQTNLLAHTKWMCKYHIVFTPKYRRKIVYNQYKSDLRSGEE